MKSKNKPGSTIFWWLMWIVASIGSFFLAVWFWTPFIADHFGSIQNTGVTFIWIVAVFGTWLVALLPLMILMYWKVDKAYEDVRLRREAKQNTAKQENPYRIKSVPVEEVKRIIPKDLRNRLKKIPQTIRGGHLMTAILNDGRRIENVFIARKKVLLGVYNQQELTFQANDIIRLEPTNLENPPDFTQKGWLKFDETN